MSSRTTDKNSLRVIRHTRVRSRIAGSAVRPRLTVHRSNRYISAQLIDDDAGKTLAAAHGKAAGGALSAQAVAVGAEIAKKAKVAGLTAAVFDRGGYRYAGQIKRLADAAREGGLAF